MPDRIILQRGRQQNPPLPTYDAAAQSADQEVKTNSYS